MEQHFPPARHIYTSKVITYYVRLRVILWGILVNCLKFNIKGMKSKSLMINSLTPYFCIKRGGWQHNKIWLRSLNIAQFSRYLGIYNNRNVRGSATTKSLHAEGRALDWAFDANDAQTRDEAMRFINQLLANDAVLAREMGIQEVIFNRKIWSAEHPREGLRDYNGANPHTDHIHIGLNRKGAKKQTSFWQ